MRLLVLLILPVLLLTSCKKESIEYPTDGHYGVNILDESTTTFYLAPEYSLHAKLPEESSIRIVFTNTSSNVTSEDWWMQSSSNVNLIVSNKNEISGAQTFESVDGALEIDLRMGFTGDGTATIDIYENGASTPTRTKLINW
jgi:hypothetical protein